MKLGLLITVSVSVSSVYLLLLLYNIDYDHLGNESKPSTRDLYVRGETEV